MLVTSEAGKIRKKREEEERRRMMAEGFDKLQKALDEKVAARAAVQAVNEDLKAVSQCTMAKNSLEMYDWMEWLFKNDSLEN